MVSSALAREFVVRLQAKGGRDRKRIGDVTATILAWYGLPLNDGMSGKSIF